MGADHWGIHLSPCGSEGLLAGKNRSRADFQSANWSIWGLSIIISCRQNQQGPSFVLTVSASVSSGQYGLRANRCGESSVGQAYVKNSDQLWLNEKGSIFLFFFCCGENERLSWPASHCNITIIKGLKAGVMKDGVKGRQKCDVKSIFVWVFHLMNPAFFKKRANNCICVARRVTRKRGWKQVYMEQTGANWSSHPKHRSGHSSSVIHHFLFSSWKTALLLKQKK